MEDNKNPFVENEEQSIQENAQENIDIEENVDTASNEQLQEENIEQLDEYKEKYEALNNNYIRLSADFDNFRKRTAQEKENLAKFACCDVLSKLTTVLDTFDRAQEQLKDIDNCQTVKESYEVAYKQLVDTLKKIGLEEIEAMGKEFNPNEHEAITQVPSDELEPDSIAFVAQKGYKVKDKVIRPALVGVAIKKEN